MLSSHANGAGSQRAPRFEDAMNNPEKFFADPSDVVNSTAFNREQKIDLLKQWKNDLSSRHEAETEGMDRPQQARKQLLPAVTNALIELGVESKIENQ